MDYQVDFARVAFTTNRLLEFFSEKELSMQIGHDRRRWALALLKELVDNALDACEAIGVKPEINITLDDNLLTVEDNAGGIPESVLSKSLDYLVRVSDKNHYASPTRGQLGNALKCVWAAPFVVSGDYGKVEIITGGKIHTITVTLDRIAQVPHIEHTINPDGIVKNGTLVRLHWPGLAGELTETNNPYFYKAYEPINLLADYAAFNPHASFTYSGPDGTLKTHAEKPDWRKWGAGDPIPPHWYTNEKLRALIAAYISAEAEGEKAITVREFISQFRGLSGTAKQKRIIDQLNLSGAYLSSLAQNGDIPISTAQALLEAMKAETRPVKPDQLGVIGEAALQDYMIWAHSCTPESIKYKAIKTTYRDDPYVIELAFGIFDKDNQDKNRYLAVGLNWTPAINFPLASLQYWLGEARVDNQDPIALIVHIATPKMDFTDRGKSRLDLPYPIAEKLEAAIRAITADWKKAKRQADQNDRVRQRELDELRKQKQKKALSVKDAVYRIMPQAYAHASGGGAIVANARQIMYAARPMVIELTGGKCWKESSYFTQRLLPEFINDNQELTQNWDVVFDARGKLIEPHTRKRVDLGTVAVRRYMAGWHDCIGSEISEFILKRMIDTSGPDNRYRYALFVEKEGFNELFEQVRLSERYDLAIMSTKGMSVTAARELVERLSIQGVTILVLHDFDKSGITILDTLANDTDRYQYTAKPAIIDLGLTLADVESMGLQGEPVFYPSKVDPRINLSEHGATLEDCNYLVEGGRPGNWRGKRVEINAMTSPQLIDYLENKFAQIGVTKFIPDSDDLIAAYRRAALMVRLQKAIDTEIKKFGSDERMDEPDNLEARIMDLFNLDNTQSWDEAIYTIAHNHKPTTGGADWQP